jgi:hypothetical protein
MSGALKTDLAMKHYTFFTGLLLCMGVALFAQQNVSTKKIFKGEYFGYASESGKNEIFPPIIKKSVCDFNTWGYAEVNVNTEKLEKAGFANPLKMYTEKKFSKNLLSSHFDTEMLHAWGVIDKNGMFVIEPRFGHLYINREIKDPKYLFLMNPLNPDYGIPVLVNRTTGNLTPLNRRFIPWEVKWIDSDYFYYDLYKNTGYNRNFEKARGLMRYDGKLIIDTLYFDMTMIKISEARLFLAVKAGGKEKELYRLSETGDHAINLTQGKYSDIVYVDGTDYFKVTSNGATEYLSADGNIIDENLALNVIDVQQKSDFEKRLFSGDLSDDEFRNFYNNDLKSRLSSLPSDLRDGYGVISVWSPAGDKYFSINNGSFGTSGESRSVKKSYYWAGCNQDLQKQYPDLKERSSTSFIMVPYGTYEVKLYDAHYGTTQNTTYITTYTAVVSSHNRCWQVRID